MNTYKRHRFPVPFVTSGVVAEDGPLMTIVALLAIGVLMALMRDKLNPQEKQHQDDAIKTATEIS